MFKAEHVGPVHFYEDRIARLLKDTRTKFHLVYSALPQCNSSSTHPLLISLKHSTYLVLKEQKLNTTAWLCDKLTFLVCHGYFRNHFSDKKNHYVGHHLIIPLVSRHIPPFAISPFFDLPVARVKTIQPKKKECPLTACETTTLTDDDDDIYN